ncbi:hypothetical protein [Microbacterium sp. Bi121]|uniref:hypothetical protein n=1 Tax=Microbacterium sp. Bi121 TaxID=2822348 RepID=UPI001DDD65DD|nr:hypothetical protein [Microbacterium sp. Bi121]CAH0220824.1 hypothetical protein SRABI121_02967 [Microbacterium sp. Bi121]
MTPDTSKLDTLVGPRRRAEPVVHDGRDVVRLKALVNSAAVNSSPTLTSPRFVKNAKARKSRGYRRIDWLNVGAAAIAIVVAVGTATFTGVQMASASPTAGAVQILTSDEAALAGAEQGVMASIERLDETIQKGITEAAALRKTLVSLQETDEQPGTADSDSLNAAIAAVDVYEKSLSEIVLPAAPKPYVRGDVDKNSLQSVGDAIDRVQESSEVVDSGAEEVRTARASVDGLGTTFTTALATFASSFAAHAQAEVENYPVAEQEFRDAVAAAAAVVGSAQLNTSAGQNALAAYRDAVIALHDDDYRARVEEEAARDNQQNNNWTPPATEEPVDPGATEPPVEQPPVEDAPPADDEPLL